MEAPPMLSTQSHTDEDEVADDFAGEPVVTVTPSDIPNVVPEMKAETVEPTILEASETMDSAAAFDEEQDDTLGSEPMEHNRDRLMTRDRSDAQLDDVIDDADKLESKGDRKEDDEEEEVEAKDEVSFPEVATDPVLTEAVSVDTGIAKVSGLPKRGGLPRPGKSPSKDLPPPPERTSNPPPNIPHPPSHRGLPKRTHSDPGLESEIEQSSDIGFSTSAPPEMLSDHHSAPQFAPVAMEEDPLSMPDSPTSVKPALSLTGMSKALVNDGARGDPSSVDREHTTTKRKKRGFALGINDDDRPRSRTEIPNREQKPSKVKSSADLDVPEKANKRQTSVSLDNSVGVQGAMMPSVDPDEHLQKMKKAQTTAIMKEWDNFGSNLGNVRKALLGIASAQKKFSERVEKVVSDHGLSLHNAQSELLSTWTLFFKIVQISAEKQKECATYITDTIEGEMAQIQRNDKSILKQNKLKFQKSKKNVEAAISESKQANHRYKELVEKCKEMSDPDWKPKEKRNWYGKKEKEIEPVSVVVGRTYDEQMISEQEYWSAVERANKLQREHEQIVSDVKHELLMEQQRRINCSIYHLKKLADCFTEIVDGEKSKKILETYKLNVNELDKVTLLKNEYLRLIADHGKRVVPKDVQFVKTKWKNIFVSVEEAMVEDSGLEVPMVVDCLCKKIKEMDGFQTEGIFRKAANKSHQNELRRQLNSGNYDIQVDNPHIPACVLKDWLRNLKDPLIPYDYYHVCINMAKDGKLTADGFDVFMSQLSPVRRKTIIYLVKFFRELLAPPNHEKTRMDVKNIAIVVGPNILRYSTLTPEDMMNNTHHMQTFCHKLIENLRVDSH